MATVRGHGPTRGTRRGAIDGGKIWWVAPDYPTASEIWRDLKRATRGAWADKDEVERRVELVTGGSVSVKSAHDPDTLVAVGLDGLVMDEAARVDPSAWYGSLRPTLSDRQGWAVFISTPKGHNWFYKLYEHAGKTAEWARWQRPTSENPLIPAAELAQAKADTPSFFRQEYEALFTDLEGAEWPAEYFDDHIWFDEWPRDLAVRGIALDPSCGKKDKSGDYRAYVWGGMDVAGNFWMDAQLTKRPLAQTVADGFEIYRQWPCDGFGIEANQFQELLAIDFMRVAAERAMTLPLFKFNNYVDKKVRIRRLGALLAQKKIRFKANSAGTKILVDQLMCFGEDSKAHDDGPDAAEMLKRLCEAIAAGGQRRRQNEGMEFVTT